MAVPDRLAQSPVDRLPYMAETAIPSGFCTITDTTSMRTDTPQGLPRNVTTNIYIGAVAGI